MDLFESESLEAQGAIYNELEIELWNVFLSNLVKQPLLMAMLGVPRPQIKLILDGHPGGLEGYIKDKMRHVLTEVPIWDNYFWRVYVHGAYSEKCRPLYLKEENFSFRRALSFAVARESMPSARTGAMTAMSPPHSAYISRDFRCGLGSSRGSHP